MQCQQVRAAEADCEVPLALVPLLHLKSTLLPDGCVQIQELAQYLRAAAPSAHVVLLSLFWLCEKVGLAVSCTLVSSRWP